MIFIFRIFDVSVRRIGTEERPAFGSGFLCAFDPAGKVTAVQVVDQRPKRGVEAVDVQRVAAVKTVIDRYVEMLDLQCNKQKNSRLGHADRNRESFF